MTTNWECTRFDSFVGAFPSIVCLSRSNFRPPDIGSSRGERFLALEGQADTQPTSGVAHPFRIQLST